MLLRDLEEGPTEVVGDERGHRGQEDPERIDEAFGARVRIEGMDVAPGGDAQEWATLLEGVTGGAIKTLGVFTEKRTEIHFVRLEPGARWRIRGRRLCFVIEGSGCVAGENYLRHTTVHSESGEQAEVTATSPTEILDIGLPDFGTVTIHYMPNKACLELKSLKMYIHAYRNLGIFYENVVNRVLRDIVRAARPVSASVAGEFTPRGGLHTKVSAQWSGKKR